MAAKNDLSGLERFYAVFRKEISPILEELNWQRKQKIAFFIIGVFFVLSYCTNAVSHIIETQHPPLLSLLGDMFLYYLGGLCVCVAIFFFFEYSFKTLVKEKTGKLFMAALEYEVDPFFKRHIKEELIDESCIFGKYNTKKEEDNLFGSVNKIPYAITELSLSDLTHYAGKTSGFDVFCGVILNVFAKTKFENVVTIGPREISVPPDKDILFLAIGGFVFVWGVFCLIFCGLTFHDLMPSGLFLFVFAAMSSRLLRKKLNKPEYLKRESVLALPGDYVLYSDDPDLAKKSLKKGFTVELDKVRRRLRADNIRVAFLEENILVALDIRRSFFDYGRLLSKLEVNDYLKIFNDVNVLLNFIKYVQKNQELIQ